MQLSLKGIFQPPTLLNFLIDSKQLAKPGLSLSVVFSSLASYLLGVDHFDLLQFSLLGIGGFLVVGASNVFNQIIERDTDALMTRTQQRPLPEKRMQVATAYFVGFTLGVSGLFLLYAIAPFCAYLGFIAMLLYALVYTPLKKITPLAVFVGAIPGAIPFMLGWFAATKSFGIECFFLFLVQFFWQFPHFWSIAWLQFEDYKKAGIQLLPMGEKNKKAALQIIIYTISMLVVSILPVLKITGKIFLHPISAGVIVISGLFMFNYSIKLYKYLDTFYAKKLMIASIFYITLVQIVYVVDKFVR